MSHKLAVRTVGFTVKINDDTGSDAKKDLITWKPELPKGWYYLGPGATNHPMWPEGVIVRELVPGTLGQINDWEQVWNDGGSKNKTNFSLWRGVPENSEHIVLGGFFVRSHNKPTIDDVRGMKSIPRDLLVQIIADQEVWNDSGSGAEARGAIWSMTAAGRPDTVVTGAFIPVSGINAGPPYEFAFAIDGEKVSTETPGDE